MKQLPVLPPAAYDAPVTPALRAVDPAPLGGDTLAHWIAARALRLIYTAHALRPWAEELLAETVPGAPVPPPFRWDPAERADLRAQLDALFLRLYDIDRDDAEYILDSFPIVKRQDIKAHGRYVTAERILDYYDRFADVPPYADNTGAGHAAPTAAPAPQPLAPPVRPPAVQASADAPHAAPLFTPDPPRPASGGRIITVGGQRARLIEKRPYAPGQTLYRVILEETGEAKTFISPPANVVE